MVRSSDRSRPGIGRLMTPSMNPATRNRTGLAEESIVRRLGRGVALGS